LYVTTTTPTNNNNNKKKKTKKKKKKKKKKTKQKKKKKKKQQGIHTYIPETNHVSRVYSVAATLRVLLMVHITLSSLLNSFVLLH
jgi:Flp pilus assembly protein TadB